MRFEMNINELHAFVVNVPSQFARLMKFKQTVQPFFPIKIHPFNAIPLDEAKKYTNLKSKKRWKEISNERSFGSIVQLAKENGWKNVLIFEDDAIVRNLTKTQVTEFLNEIPDKFGICYLGCYLRKAKDKSIKKCSPHIFQLIGSSFNIWGAHAVIINESVYDLMINTLLQYNNKIITDKQICRIVNKCVTKNYMVNPPIVFQAPSLSSAKYGSMHGKFNFENLEKTHKNFISSCKI